MDVRQCVFCLQHKSTDQFNREHVVPRALSGTYVIQSVCSQCNSGLGSTVDAGLTDSFLVTLARHRYGLVANSGKVPNPFGAGSLAVDPHQTVHYLPPSPGREGKVTIRQRVTQRMDAKGVEHIAITLDASEEEKLPGIVNTMLRRRGKTPLPAEVILGQIERHTLHQPSLSYPVTEDWPAVRKALLKIAYECVCGWLGERYLDDETAQLIRACLGSAISRESPASWQLRGEVRHSGTDAILGLWADQPRTHVVMAMAVGKNISVYVKIFDIYEAIFVVSESPDRYAFDDGRVLTINTETGRFEDTDVLSALELLMNAHGSVTHSPHMDARVDVDV